MTMTQSKHWSKPFDSDLTITYRPSTIFETSTTTSDKTEVYVYFQIFWSYEACKQSDKIFLENNNHLCVCLCESGLCFWKASEVYLSSLG